MHDGGTHLVGRRATDVRVVVVSKFFDAITELSIFCGFHSLMAQLDLVTHRRVWRQFGGIELLLRTRTQIVNVFFVCIYFVQLLRRDF